MEVATADPTLVAVVDGTPDNDRPVGWPDVKLGVEVVTSEVAPTNDKLGAVVVILERLTVALPPTVRLGADEVILEGSPTNLKVAADMLVSEEVPTNDRLVCEEESSPELGTDIEQPVTTLGTELMILATDPVD